MASTSRRLKAVKVKRVMQKEEFCKFLGVAQDESACNFFKTTKEVMSLLKK